jgi:hypothetical protein
MLLRFSILLFFLVGCVDAPDVSESTHAVKIAPGDDGTCPVWECGSNSPIIDFIEFHDAHELGDINTEGFHIVDFERRVVLFGHTFWISYRPDIVNDEIIARATSGDPDDDLKGSQVIGMRFVFQRGRVSYYLNVKALGRAPMSARYNGVQKYTRTYELTWQYAASPVTVHSLCGASSDNDGLDNFHAVVFDDDRIESDTITVTGLMADWFNIGCKGHTLAKQHLMGHTKAATAILALPLSQVTSLQQRTANLKMLSGDYCGDGDPFTVAGMPLRWAYLNGWFSNLTIGQLEARWDENGAICLNTPRVDFQYPQPAGGVPQFPNGVEMLLDDVDTDGPADDGDIIWCTPQNRRPPPCTGSVFDFQGAHIVSLNPAGP